MNKLMGKCIEDSNLVRNIPSLPHEENSLEEYEETQNVKSIVKDSLISLCERERSLSKLPSLNSISSESSGQ